VKRLVIDARMLGYSGIGTYLEHLLPLVLPKLTAHDPVVVQPDRYGFKGGLAKPFGRDQLLEMLLRVLGRRNPDSPPNQ